MEAHASNDMTVADQLFYTTVRIETRSGGSVGCGTGFFFIHPLSKENSVVFLVTNKHVIANADAISLSLHVSSNGIVPDGRHTANITEVQHAIFGHQSPEVDVAVMPMGALFSLVLQDTGKQLFFKGVSLGQVPSQEQMNSFDSIEDVVFVGYPNGLWDRVNLMPVARRGTTATPIFRDYEGEPKFLIDASVFGGSSGSPVFLWSNGTYTDRSGALVLGGRFFLLGTVAAVFYRTSMYDVLERPLPVARGDYVQSMEMLDLGVVYKARTIVETIEHALNSMGLKRQP